MNLTIRSEKDYSKFSFIEGFNRVPNDRQISIIMASLQELDLSMAKPIMTYKGQILDGQHRFLACKALNMPIYYIELEHLKEEEVYKALHLLNSNAKNWQSKDYINLYSNLSHQNPKFLDYRFLQEFINSYKVSPSIAVYFLSAFDRYKSAIDDDFKDGNFKIEDRKGELTPSQVRQDALYVASRYQEVRDRIIKGYRKDLKTRFVKGPNFIFAFARLTLDPNYNQDTMVAALSVDMDKEVPILVHCDSIQAYYKILAEIHNSRCRSGVGYKVAEYLVFEEQDLEESAEE